jgi:hypothetical protein
MPGAWYMKFYLKQITKRLCSATESEMMMIMKACSQNMYREISQLLPVLLLLLLLFWSIHWPRSERNVIAIVSCRRELLELRRGMKRS